MNRLGETRAGTPSFPFQRYFVSRIRRTRARARASMYKRFAGRRFTPATTCANAARRVYVPVHMVEVKGREIKYQMLTNCEEASQQRILMTRGRKSA